MAVEKLSGLFVNIKSTHEGFSGFLKHIGYVICKFHTKPIIGESFMHELKSPSKIMFSYFDKSESMLLERQFRCDSILLLFGL